MSCIYFTVHFLPCSLPTCSASAPPPVWVLIVAGTPPNCKLMKMEKLYAYTRICVERHGLVWVCVWSAVWFVCHVWGSATCLHSNLFVRKPNKIKVRDSCVTRRLYRSLLNSEVPLVQCSWQAHLISGLFMLLSLQPGASECACVCLFVAAGFMILSF